MLLKLQLLLLVVPFNDLQFVLDFVDYLDFCLFDDLVPCDIVLFHLFVHVRFYRLLDVEMIMSLSGLVLNLNVAEHLHNSLLECDELILPTYV